MDNTDEDISHGQPSDPIHAQERRTSVQSMYLLSSYKMTALFTLVTVPYISMGLKSRLVHLEETAASLVCNGRHIVGRVPKLLGGGTPLVVQALPLS